MIRALLALLGCQSTPYPAPIVGTTYRISEDVPATDSEIRVDILTSYTDCAEAKVLDMDACVPRADRASGEVRLAFRLRDPKAPNDIFRAINPEQIEVLQDGAIQSEVELVPHEPIASGQLFIVLLDGSGSMYEQDGERIRKVYSALLAPSVIEGFYPEHNNKTGVVLLRFTDGVTGLDGGPPRILSTAEEYRAMVRDHLLKSSGGYTYLYEAVSYAVTDLLDQDAIKTFLTVKGAEPSIVVVTDGFNNQQADDTCATNVDRLQSVLDVVREVRTNLGGSVRPTVFTVGLGVPYREGNKPKELNRPVTAQDLCAGYANERIDGRLEDLGLDHVSMQWIAEAGGGRSFVRSKARGLSEVLRGASATRYRWYEVWYRVPDNFYHRRSFDVVLRLKSSDRAYSTVTVHPNGWIDGPTAMRLHGDRWHTPTPFRHTFTILMPALGTIVLLNYVGPALFNTRRALFRRARPRRIDRGPGPTREG